MNNNISKEIYRSLSWNGVEECIDENGNKDGVSKKITNIVSLNVYFIIKEMINRRKIRTIFK